jgi:hypothetical protein
MTGLKVSSADLATRRHLAPGERLYTGGVFTLAVDVSALGGGVGLQETSSLPARIRDDGSLPLLVGLRAAALRTPA